MFVKKLNVVKKIDPTRLAEYERAGYAPVTPKEDKAEGKGKPKA